MIYYVLRYNEGMRRKIGGISPDRSYVALDAASGGYPYPASLNCAERFLTRERAENYARMFPNEFDLLEAELTLKEVPWKSTSMI